MMKERLRRTILFALVSGMSAVETSAARAAATIRVPLTATRWRVVMPTRNGPRPDVQFTKHEGFPEGVLVLKSGSAALNDLTFRNGTIEFDMKSLGEEIPGIQFRQQGVPGTQNGEEFYVRTFPECRASNDCIQYTPVINGFLLWNAYPQYQTQAFILDGWNHIKLVVSGRRMNVYINRFSSPALMVGSLESRSPEGGLQFHGPAIYANLVVTPDATEGLSPQATADPTATDRGFVRAWQVSSPTKFRSDIAPTYVDAPARSEQWAQVSAGRFGLLNLNRLFKLTNDPPPLIWLRSTVISDREQTKHVSLGWSGQVWIFVDGKLVAQGKNFYDDEALRRNPDGRLSLENGSFDVPLHKGSNELLLALHTSIHDDNKTPNYYAWGVEMRFEDAGGLSSAK